MRKETILAFSIVFLLVLSGLAGAISIKKDFEENEEKSSLNISSDPPKGVGGWHTETSLQTYGKEYDDIEKAGGNGGGWEVPYDSNAVRIWAENNRVRAWYVFDINEGPVKYVNYQTEYKDVGWFSDSPDALISKWDGTWDSFSNIGGVGQDNDNYEWESHIFNENSDKYVNSQGQIKIAAQAYDDSSLIHQDNLAVRTMKISYEAADEEIFDHFFNKYDSDDDGAADSIEIKIDADVADDGDGTEVDVTGICKLRDPTGSIIDQKQSTWTITDHQVEYGIIHVSSLGGQNGMYTLEVELFDQHGNKEDEISETFYLVPDPKRTIDFYVSPNYGGSIQILGEVFLDNESTIVSDGTYSVSAIAEEYFGFVNWECTGGVTVDNSGSAETTITVSNNGSLKANFTFLLNTLYFFVVPDFAGQIMLGDSTFENNTGVYLDDGEYNLEAATLVDTHYFNYWYIAGDIAVGDEYSTQTTLTVTGDGILYAVFSENTPPNKPEMPDGPLSGGVYETYTYSTTTTDPDGDQVYYKWDWNDGEESGWLGPYDSGEPAGTSHAWTGSRTYQVRVKSKDQFGAESDWSDPISVGIFSPPNAPIIKGTTSGQINTEYEFTISANDPDNDKVYFYIEWGDNTIEDWIGPYSSGAETTVKHTFRKQGTYQIKALAKDEHDVVSQSWGSLVVEMPKTKTTQFRLFEMLFDMTFINKLLEKLEFLKSII